MAAYPASSPFGSSVSNSSAAMAYLKPYHHMNGLTALGVTAGLESLQSHYSHGGKMSELSTLKVSS